MNNRYLFLHDQNQVQMFDLSEDFGEANLKNIEFHIPRNESESFIKSV